MDNTTGLGAQGYSAADYQSRKSQDQETRIRALELQVHTLTAAVQHLMSVTKPLIEIARQAEEQANHGYIIRSGG